jgi:hypothetical protein
MAYYIFLKSLRSPEEFTKNPHIKIPPKSHPTNIQSLCIFKKSKIYSEIILLRLRPIRYSLAEAGPLRPAGHRARARPTRPEQPWRICQKAPLLRVSAVRQRRFLSLRSLPSGTRPSVPPLPRVGQPQSCRHLTSPHSITPRRPASSIETPIKAPYSTALIPPLESPLTPSMTINGLGCKSPAVTHWHLHPDQPRPPIKGEHHPRVSPHHSPPLFSSLHA